jgi:hypothetical protein
MPAGPREKQAGAPKRENAREGRKRVRDKESEMCRTCIKRDLDRTEDFLTQAAGFICMTRNSQRP